MGYLLYRSTKNKMATRFPILKFLRVGSSCFFLLNKYAVFTLSRFFLTTRISLGTLYLVLDLVGMHSAAASMLDVDEVFVFVIRSKCFRYLL